MQVPILDLKAQLAPLRAELLAALTEVVDSTQYILGPRVERLEREIGAYVGSRHAIGVSSGTDALLLALMALEIGPGDLVITSTFSFFATAGVVARVGARPVLADIEPRGFNLDPAGLESALAGMAAPERGRVKAILPVHLYGQCAELGPIGEIARRHGIPVIEDAAQSIGASYPAAAGEKSSGTLGLMGCYSFFPSKNLGAMGDGGMVVTDDEALAHRLRSLRMHGEEAAYKHARIGGNFRLDPLQAALLSVKLPHLDGWHRARRRNALRYTELFRARGIREVTPPPELYGDRAVKHPHIYNQYMIRAERRDALQQHLGERGVAARVYYPIPFHLQPCFQYLGYRAGAFPEAERAAAEVLALPVYPELTEAMQAYVVDQIADFYRA
ncbi:MAG: DegT/DnrJ/EryC1/StrS family aminotransferase [Candidatus Lambdaproteobacteria bacterium]|nr:DegT/DnrJ/EryC1/StrS family aminotransferase [Candidatus Lambdaproteobacteria bacterium]